MFGWISTTRVSQSTTITSTIRSNIFSPIAHSYCVIVAVMCPGNLRVVLFLLLASVQLSTQDLGPEGEDGDDVGREPASAEGEGKEEEEVELGSKEEDDENEEEAVFEIGKVDLSDVDYDLLTTADLRRLSDTLMEEEEVVQMILQERFFLNPYFLILHFLLQSTIFFSSILPESWL